MVGTETSVYVGCFTRDYEAASGRQMDNSLLYQATGSGLAMLSNRLSWFYDLKGPSLTMDTACSSSLLAMYVQSSCPYPDLFTTARIDMTIGTWRARASAVANPKFPSSVAPVS
jgi:hypothetical protein